MAGLISKIDLELHLPAGFPDKYRDAVVNAMNLCTVKKHLHQPPTFEISHGGRVMADAFDPQHAGRLEDPARLAALPQAAVVSLLRLAGDETVVDYGAGTGIYTIAVAEAVPDGRVIAVEALPRLADMLRAKLTPELAERLELVETDTNSVPAPDAVADRVVMVDVLHHLYDQPEALAEVTRLLRPGGLFVVVDWGDCERPVGPPLEHVLGLAAVREVIASMGLSEVEAHEPGASAALSPRPGGREEVGKLTGHSLWVWLWVWISPGGLKGGTHFALGIAKWEEAAAPPGIRGVRRLPLRRRASRRASCFRRGGS